MMKLFKFCIQTSIVMLTSLLLSHAAFSATKNTQPLDQIVAVVNDSVITQSELDQAIETATKQLQGSNVPLPPAGHIAQTSFRSID